MSAITFGPDQAAQRPSRRRDEMADVRVVNGKMKIPRGAKAGKAVRAWLDHIHHPYDCTGTFTLVHGLAADAVERALEYYEFISRDAHSVALEITSSTKSEETYIGLLYKVDRASDAGRILCDWLDYTTSGGSKAFELFERATPVWMPNTKQRGTPVALDVGWDTLVNMFEQAVQFRKDVSFFKEWCVEQSHGRTFTVPHPSELYDIMHAYMVAHPLAKVSHARDIISKSIAYRNTRTEFKSVAPLDSVETEQLAPQPAAAAVATEVAPARDRVAELTAQLRAAAAEIGRPIAEHWPFLRAYNLFRISAIVHGISKRAIDGNANASDAIENGEKAGALADLGWACVSN